MFPPCHGASPMINSTTTEHSETNLSHLSTRRDFSFNLTHFKRCLVLLCQEISTILHFITLKIEPTETYCILNGILSDISCDMIVIKGQFEEVIRLTEKDQNVSQISAYFRGAWHSFITILYKVLKDLTSSLERLPTPHRYPSHYSTFLKPTVHRIVLPSIREPAQQLQALSHVISPILICTFHQNLLQKDDAIFLLNRLNIYPFWYKFDYHNRRFQEWFDLFKYALFTNASETYFSKKKWKANWNSLQAIIGDHHRIFLKLDKISRNASIQEVKNMWNMVEEGLPALIINIMKPRIRTSFYFQVKLTPEDKKIEDFVELTNVSVLLLSNKWLPFKVPTSWIQNASSTKARTQLADSRNKLRVNNEYELMTINQEINDQSDKTISTTFFSNHSNSPLSLPLLLPPSLSKSNDEMSLFKDQPKYGLGSQDDLFTTALIQDSSTQVDYLQPIARKSNSLAEINAAHLSTSGPNIGIQHNPSQLTTSDSNIGIQHLPSQLATSDSDIQPFPSHEAMLELSSSLALHQYKKEQVLSIRRRSFHAHPSSHSLLADTDTESVKQSNSPLSLIENRSKISTNNASRNHRTHHHRRPPSRLSRSSSLLSSCLPISGSSDSSKITAQPFHHASSHCQPLDPLLHDLYSLDDTTLPKASSYGHSKSQSSDESLQLIQQATSVASVDVILHFHGGGFISGSPGSHEKYLRRWSKICDAVVFSVDYSLAPQSKYPIALNECFFFYHWLVHPNPLHIIPRKVILVGDSAGGNLALAVVFKAIQHGVRIPDGLVLAYPATDLSYRLTPSRILFSNDTMIPCFFLEKIIEAYIDLEHFDPTTNCFLSPTYASDEYLSQLPSNIVFMMANYDPLLDDSIYLIRRLENLKKSVVLKTYDAPHGFWNLDSVLPIADLTIKQAAQYMNLMFRGQDLN